MRRTVLLVTVFALVLTACADGSGAPLGDATVQEPTPSTGADQPAEVAEPSEAAPAEGAATTVAEPDDTPGTSDETLPPDGDDVIDPPEPTKPSPPETVPVTTVPPVVGEVPADLLELILADAASRVTTEAAITVVRAQAVTWSDGSLGCPEPGMRYTQALVEGYWVVLDAGGQTLDYRASASGAFKLCPDSMGVPPVGDGNS